MIKLKKKLIFINSFIYDKVMFEKFNFDNYINNSLIDTEFWRLNFDHVIDKKNFKEKNRLEHEEQEYIINTLFSCKEPSISPSNKSVFTTLKVEDLDKKFN